MNPHTRTAIVNRLKKLEEWKRVAECALDSAEEALDAECCDCGTDDPPCELCLVQDALKTIPRNSHNGF